MVIIKKKSNPHKNKQSKKKLVQEKKWQTDQKCIFFVIFISSSIFDQSLDL